MVPGTKPVTGARVVNIRQAIRQLVIRPGFAIAVIGMLAIGIGATTAIFSLFQQVLLERLPVPEPDRLFELRVEGNTVQMIGITRDAPSLIGLIEQSHRFTRATFFAPTTRSPSDTGERFHIEAQIEAGSGPRT